MTTVLPVHKNEEEKKRRSFGSGLLTVITEFLVVAALVVGGYPFWEILWTSYEVQGGVNDAISAFEDRFPPGEGEPEHYTTAPPLIDTPGNGEIFGVLHVPKWDYMRTPIGAGTGPNVLDMGYAGWYETTQLPGQEGNFALAGHRRSYGNNFRLIHELSRGDSLVVETEETYIVYDVLTYRIVNPDATWVLAPEPEDIGEPGDRLITLTTCHPEYGNSERYIVFGEFSYWTLKSEGKPEVIREEIVLNPSGTEH